MEFFYAYWYGLAILIGNKISKQTKTHRDEHFLVIARDNSWATICDACAINGAFFSCLLGPDVRGRYDPPQATDQMSGISIVQARQEKPLMSAWHLLRLSAGGDPLHAKSSPSALSHDRREAKERRSVPSVSRCSDNGHRLSQSVKHPLLEMPCGLFVAPFQRSGR